MPSDIIEVDSNGNPAPRGSVLGLAHVVYALHALAIALGIVGTATTIVGGFLASPLSIVAVIINYVKRPDARGSWIESHYRWQIRTFWFALLWIVLIALVSVVLLPIFFLGAVVWVVLCVLLSIWLIYRIAKGWLRLKDGKPMYV